ncbi:MAG: hypothetical protein AAF138_10615 [Planctomycetota bacterium]
MARRTLDDILSDLGIDAEGTPTQRARREADQARSEVAAEEAGSDSATDTARRPARTPDGGTSNGNGKGNGRSATTFSPLPSMPANQQLFGEAGREAVEADPAIKEGASQASMPNVGDAVSEIYNPDQSDDVDDAPIALDGFLARDGAISQEQLTTALQILKQTPGRRLSELLIEQGADEVGVQQAVAEHAGLPFERVDLEQGLDGGFDGKMLQRLGVDYCKENLVVPLRTEGARAVIGCTSPDDVQLFDDVRHRLGGTPIKIVIVTAFDIRGAVEVVGGDEEPAEEVNLADILADVDEADVEVSEVASGDAVDLEQQAGESPVIRYVNHIIQTAVKEGASDIHIEPRRRRSRCVSASTACSSR